MSRRTGRLLCCGFVGLFGLKAGYHTARIFEAEWFVIVLVMAAYSFGGMLLMWRLSKHETR